MPFLFIYILKLSVSLAVVFTFYHFVLRKLTFYNWNRWYLLGYSLLSFFIALIDISPVLDRNEWSDNSLVQWVPAIQNSTSDMQPATSFNSLSGWQWVSLLIVAGMLVMLLRLFVQLISFQRMIKKAKPIAVGQLPGSGMKLYQVEEDIIPFSFGNSIFINHRLHTNEELREIVWHEFIHVKQKHSVDIICGEILCLLNWYNPFAWLLRRSIRQNLEFIADNKVLENGVDRKEYQYLLLKVIGNDHFSIAPKFNFSSLKKRIAMMNKLKTARLHLVRFLFLLPVISLMLLAFRKEIGESKIPGYLHVKFASIVYDKETNQPMKGVTIKDENSGTTAVSDKNGYFEMTFPIEEQTVIKFNLTKNGYYSFTTIHNLGKKYTRESIGVVALWGMERGDASQKCSNCIPVSFLEYAKNPGLGMDEASDIFDRYLSGKKIISANDVAVRPAAVIDTVPYVTTPNSKGYFIDVIGIDGECTVVVKDKKGKEIERVTLNQWKEQKKFEEQYGEILAPPPAPPTPPADATTAVAPVGSVPPVATANPAIPARPVSPSLIECPVTNMTPPAFTTTILGKGINLSKISREYEITDKKAELKLLDGTVEKYDLTDSKEKAVFEKKYGKIYHINTNVNANIATTVRANVNARLSTNVNANVNTNVDAVITIPPTTIASSSKLITSVAPVAIGNNGLTTVASALSPLPSGSAITVADPYGHVITGNEDIIITITKNTSRQDLDKFISQMKAKGVELDFDEIEYNEKGKLVSINGTMKSGGSRSNFVATDFHTLVLAMIKKGEKVYFKVSTKDNGEVI